MFSLLGKLVYPDKVLEGTIYVENGKIAKIIEGFSTKAATVIDYRNQYILPGLIEVHGHMREPGMTQKEDVSHGTRAALAGGFTAIIDMPNTNPPTTTVALLKEKISSIYPNKAYTDYAFFLGVGKNNLEELKKVDSKMIAGVKIFMAGHETTPTTIPDDTTLSYVFEILAKRNILAAVHAEDQELVNYYTNKYKHETKPETWSKARPKEVVIQALKRAIALAKKHSIKLYLLHLSTAEEFKLVEKAKKEGVNIFGELVSYQLIFNTDDYPKLGNKIKVAPALRTPQDQNELWNLFGKKVPDVLCSEHTPHEWETKNQENVWRAQSGMPNIQEHLPAVITKWVERFGKDMIEECLQTISLLNAKNPAHIFGFNSKGSLEAGKDADFTVIDPNKKWRVNKKDLFSKCGWSAYEGMELAGGPVATFLRGIKMYENGKILSQPQGQWLHK